MKKNKREEIITFKATHEIKKMLKALSDKHTEGNISMMIRKLIKEASI